MSHTPTPWGKNLFTHPYSNKLKTYGLDEEDYDHAVACVNACEGMKDPAAEIAEKDSKIAKLTQEAIESLHLYQIVVNGLSGRDEELIANKAKIAQLEARVAELEEDIRTIVMLSNNLSELNQ